ncbi:DUF1540 domain-containing protein [Vallitalea pronyensis]|uniref:DUF1540 domain-containing protein n=1 Tax=Vallitalea pronyensis TaxID=1348613 RepID=A0A8J8MI21_9FIRM|nr:DUF1540 domain-containing protein [Vallitalea pronyensis]QUI21921.1 DUF1540 domain-containing protein [Vallitalea pronyensis]
MDLNNNANTSIGCTVNECRHHTNNDYCSLNHINVVTSSNSSHADTIQCTDCASFEKK